MFCFGANTDFAVGQNSKWREMFEMLYFRNNLVSFEVNEYPHINIHNSKET